MDLTRIVPNFEMPQAESNVKGLVGKAVGVIMSDDGSEFKFRIENAKVTEKTEDLSERQKAVYGYLGKNFKKIGATAKELSVAMYKDGLVPSPERNSVHPRLRELINLGLVSVVGKKACQYTDRTVSIYKVSE